MLIFLIVILLLVMVPDVAIWHFYVTPQAAPLWRILWWLPMVALGITLAGTLLGWNHNLFMRAFFLLVLFVVFPKLLFALTAWLTGWRVALALDAVVVGAFAYGATWGYRRLVVRQETFASELVPTAFDGYRIVQLSDLHLGTYGNDPSFIRRLVDEVNRQQPDLIVFTGDLINVAGSEPAPFVEELSRLRARDGVYSVMGNHDYALYGRHGGEAAIAEQIRLLQDYERQIGWRLLLNEHVRLHRGADSLALVGVENIGRGFISRGDLGMALHGLADGEFKVLLSHDPTHWRMEVLPQTDIPLMLAGHTHAAQLQVGRFSPSQWMYREWGGWYEEGSQRLYVSRGVGGSVPFRLGAWPEVNVITLRSTHPERH